MITRLLTLSVLALTTSQLNAQSHVHGQGQGFIAQEQDVWMVNLTLPAADVLGFEHIPETDKERSTVKKFKSLLSNPDNSVKLIGNCKSVSTKVVLPEGDSHQGSEDKHDDHHKHNEHDEHHDHDKHDEHHEHDEHSGHKDTHSNVELTMEFSCTQNIEKIELPIFSSLKRVETINFEWFTDKGQGAKQASYTAPYITF